MIYSKQLVFPLNRTSTAVVLLYTCPTGKVAVIKELCNIFTGTPWSAAWYVGPDSNSANVKLISYTTGPATTGQSIQQRRIILTAGQTLWGNSAQTSLTVFAASGFELDA